MFKERTVMVYCENAEIFEWRTYAITQDEAETRFVTDILPLIGAPVRMSGSFIESEYTGSILNQQMNF